MSSATFAHLAVGRSFTDPVKPGDDMPTGPKAGEGCGGDAGAGCKFTVESRSGEVVVKRLT